MDEDTQVDGTKEKLKQGKWSGIVASFKKKTKLILFIVIVVVLICAGGAYHLHRSHQKVAQKEVLTKTLSQSGQFQQQNKNNDAKRVLQDYLATNPKNKEERSQAEYRLASIWLSLKDLPNARQFAELAVKDTASPTYQMYIFLGNVTKIMDDKPAAIGYFQKATNILIAKKSKTTSEVALERFTRANVATLKSASEKAQP